MTMRSIITSFALLTGALLFAQNGDIDRIPAERRQEIKAQKVAFITQRLAFTPEEAQVFWPIYNSYEAELEEVRRTVGNGRREAHDPAQVTDEQAERLLAAELAGQRRELEIAEKYSPRFKAAIGARKTLFLSRTERDFTRELLRRRKDDGRDRRTAPHKSH